MQVVGHGHEDRVDPVQHGAIVERSDRAREEGGELLSLFLFQVDRGGDDHSLLKSCETAGVGLGHAAAADDADGDSGHGYPVWGAPGLGANSGD